MAFGGLGRNPLNKPGTAPMAEINMTPLIDVMLVLLVIFIITAPLLTHAIKLDLPRAAAAPAAETGRTVTVSINGAGQIFWDDKPVSEAQMHDQFVAAGRAPTQPEIHLRADQATRYQQIAEVLSAAQQAGLTRLAFVTQPDRGVPH
jgi:biopolymer transport protein ExbD